MPVVLRHLWPSITLYSSVTAIFISSPSFFSSASIVTFFIFCFMPDLFPSSSSMSMNWNLFCRSYTMRMPFAFSSGFETFSAVMSSLKA